MDLYGRNFLTLKDFSKEEIRYFLDLAHQLKKDKKEGKIGYVKRHYIRAVLSDRIGGAPAGSKGQADGHGDFYYIVVCGE